MCGIGLVVAKKNKIESSVFQRFMNSVAHRGPDHRAQFDLDGQGWIGTNRLAIIDQQARSNQPFQFQHLTLSFNGAIYNFKKLRSQLKAEGYDFQTESDTEVVVKSYAAYGEECVSKFEGMWSFVIYDARKKQIFGSRDRFGIKPFYYSDLESAFWVGSELKQFKSAGLRLTLNSNQAQYYLESGGFKNHSKGTFYEEIFQLEPGCNLTFSIDSKTYHVDRFYSLADSPPPKEGNLIAAIESAVRDRQIADVRPAMMFSGGIDSSILLLHLLKNQTDTRSYSFIEKAESNLDESPFIESFLQKYPHENHQMELPEVLDNLIKSCMLAQDEPPASLSAVAQYMLYALAHQVGEKLMISGQGSDEIFGGYPRFMSFIPRIHFLGHPLESFRLLRKYGERLFSPERAAGSIFFDKATFQQPSFTDQKDYVLYLFEKNGLRDLLQYEDRNSMAHQIETRLPFLDRTLVEYAYHLPIEVKMQGLRPKGILIESYRDLLPSKIIHRKDKLAFDTPEEKLLDAGYIDVSKALDICMKALPDLSWKEHSEILAHTNALQKWQLYFLSRWISENI